MPDESQKTNPPGGNKPGNKRKKDETMKQLVNLTPHAIVIHHCGRITAIAPSGTIARVAQKTWAVETAWDAASQTQCIPLVRSEYGQVEGLPAPVTDTIYIVSSMVRLALPVRTDIASPVDLVRDAAGKIVGCKSLEVNGGAI